MIEIKDLATSTKTRRTTSFLFNSSSNSPSRKNSSSGLASSTQPGLGSLFDDQRPNVQVKILDSKNGGTSLHFSLRSEIFLRIHV